LPSEKSFYSRRIRASDETAEGLLLREEERRKERERKKQIASIHRRPNKTRQLRRDKGECSKMRSRAISATTVHRYVRQWFLRYDSETNLW